MHQSGAVTHDGYVRLGHRAAVITNLSGSLARILSLSPQWHRRPPVRVAHVVQAVLERLQTQGSDALVANSHAVLDWTRERWEIDEIPSIVIPNLVDVNAVRRLARGTLPAGFPLRGPIVAFSGRVQIVKGVHFLVEAMRSVWQGDC